MENPALGVRPGQLHFQDWKGNKYIYDIKENKFYLFEGDYYILAPKAIQILLDNPDFLKGIKRGLKYLGEVFRGKK